MNRIEESLAKAYTKAKPAILTIQPSGGDHLILSAAFEVESPALATAVFIPCLMSDPACMADACTCLAWPFTLSPVLPVRSPLADWSRPSACLAEAETSLDMIRAAKGVLVGWLLSAITGD